MTATARRRAADRASRRLAARHAAAAAGDASSGSACWPRLAIAVVVPRRRCSSYVVNDGWPPARHATCCANMPVHAAARDGRRAVGHHRHALGHRLTALFTIPIGVWRRSTSRSTPTRPLVQPAHRAQHPEPRGRPVDRLRHPRPRRHRPRPRPRAAPCSTAALTLSLLVLPIVIISTREAIRAVPSSIRDGLARARRDAVADDLAAGPARQPCPGIATGTILALSRAIGEAAPLLLLGAADVRHVQPRRRPQRSSPSLPIQIYNWITQPAGGVRRRSPPPRSSCCS